jgi:hypothetical protein
MVKALLITIILITIIITITILVALTHIESHRLLEESNKPMKIEEKISLWVKVHYTRCSSQY